MYCYLDVTINPEGTARKIRALMQSHHLSITGLATIINVNESTINRWRTGISVPERDHLIALMTLCGAPLDAIIDYDVIVM